MKKEQNKPDNNETEDSIIKPPLEVIKELQEYCSANNLGMSIMGSEYFCTILIGDGTLLPSEVHILAAHGMLDVVVSGRLSQMNDDLLKKNGEAEREIEITDKDSNKKETSH